MALVRVGWGLLHVNAGWLAFSRRTAHAFSMNTKRPINVGARWTVWLSCYGILLIILLICAAVEGVLQGADHGLWGSMRWRGQAYAYGGFWRGLLGSWQPNYIFQPTVMFVSYGFLHGGFMHLVVNMLTLISLGRIVVDRVGQLRFAVIYFLTLLGGAIGFAVLSKAVQPMVGASGVLFGLAGLIIGWEYKARRAAQESTGPVLRAAALLLVLNLVMYWLMKGFLAWETHLGGFLTGWTATLLFPVRSD